VGVEVEGSVGAFRQVVCSRTRHSTSQRRCNSIDDGLPVELRQLRVAACIHAIVGGLVVVVERVI
jgi:hypothetical protein